MKKAHALINADADAQLEDPAHPHKVFIREAAMDSVALERVVEAKIQGLLVNKLEEELQQLKKNIGEKDESILSLSRENAELRAQLELKDGLCKEMQVRMDKLEAVVSLHDKSVCVMKDNIQTVCMRMGIPGLELKDGRKLQSPGSIYNNQSAKAPSPLFTGGMQGTGYSPTNSDQGMAMNRTVQPNVPVAITLIGDVTFKYIDEEHLFSKPVRCAKFIVASIDEAQKQLQNFLADSPQCVVFHLGTKDVEYQNSDMLAARMQEIVHAAKELVPNSEICVSLLLPRGDTEPNKVKSQLFNFKVQELLQRDAHFIIHSELEKDGRLITKYYQTDYVSINGLDGSRKLAAHLKHGIRKAIPALQPMQVAQGPFQGGQSY